MRKEIRPKVLNIMIIGSALNLRKEQYSSGLESQSNQIRDILVGIREQRGMHLINLNKVEVYI